jgi:hypothetical protein
MQFAQFLTDGSESLCGRIQCCRAKTELKHSVHFTTESGYSASIPEDVQPQSLSRRHQDDTKQWYPRSNISHTRACLQTKLEKKKVT